MKQFPTHIVSVFGIVENDRKEILLLKSRGREVWMFPGGQVEVGENLIDALIREAREESAMDIVVGKLFCVSSNTGSYQGYNGYGLVPTKVVMGFTCEYVSGEFRPSDETTDFMWVPKEEVLQLLTVPDSADKFRAYLSFEEHGRLEYLEINTKPEYKLKLKRSI